MDSWVLDLTFGQWLIQTRERLNLRPSDCAKEAGLYASQWSDFENDRSRRNDGLPSTPSLKTVRAIAKGLGVPLKDVLEALANAGIDTSEYDLSQTPEQDEQTGEYSRTPSSQGEILRGDTADTNAPMTKADEERILAIYRRKSPKARQAAEIASIAILDQFPDIPIKDTPRLPPTPVESREEPQKGLEASAEQVENALSLPYPGVNISAYTDEIAGPEGPFSANKEEPVCRLLMQILSQRLRTNRDLKAEESLRQQMRFLLGLPEWGNGESTPAPWRVPV